MSYLIAFTIPLFEYSIHIESVGARCRGEACERNAPAYHDFLAGLDHPHSVSSRQHAQTDETTI